MTDGICEWVARKAAHAADPFADVSALPPPCAPGVGGARAVVSGRVVARSSRVQKANGRVYFPIQDCDASAFETFATIEWQF